MAVVIETTLGDITVDLFFKERPQASLNFLKLCKLKYYNYNLFHTIEHGFIAQTGDPSGSGDGGMSVFGVIEGNQKRYFECESVPKIKHSEPGLLSMVCAGEHLIGSQFFFTLGPDLISLDGKHIVIGEVTEGHEVVRKLNETICDEKHRPYKDVRITHTVVLDDPFEDPRGFRVPSRSPSPSAERLQGGRIAADEEIDDLNGKSEAEIVELAADREAKARATILEIVGDIPDAEIAPPENVLFVCKLNPVTTDDDLQIIFSRFGRIKGCEVIRDKVSGDSLQYAFIEFEDKKSCEDAYFKMDNVLIDDRRIHVDFSQSVSKMKWRGKGRGIEYLDGSDKGSFKDFDRKKAGHAPAKRTASPKQSPKRVSSRSSPMPSRSRSASRPRTTRRSRSPVRDRRRERSPQNRARGVFLTERNSAYSELRNGRNIRINQGKVDYKNRPYPESFIHRSAPKVKGRQATAGRAYARRSSDRSRRTRSRSRSRHRRRSSSETRSRRNRGRSDSVEAVRGRKRSNSRDTDRKHHGESTVARRKRSMSADGGRKARRDSTPEVRGRDQSGRRMEEKKDAKADHGRSDKNKAKRSRKRSNSRSASTDSSPSSSSSSSGDGSSDGRSKKRKKKSSKGKSKKSKKRSHNSDHSDSDASGKGGKKRKKSKSKKKKKRN